MNEYNFFADLLNKFSQFTPWVQVILGLSFSGLILGILSHNISYLLGGEILCFTENIRPLDQLKINLSDYGLPEDSMIIYINYTPEPKDFRFIPMNFEGNEPFPRKYPRNLNIFAVPIPTGQDKEIHQNTGTSIINIMVAYIPHENVNQNIKNLSRACDAFIHKDYEDTIIPACVAIEHSLKTLINKFFESQKMKKTNQKRNIMLHQTLPLILDHYNLPSIPDSILDNISKLFGLRDMLAHNGALNKGIKLNKNNISEKLCASIFVTRYLTEIGKNISNK